MDYFSTCGISSFVISFLVVVSSVFVLVLSALVIFGQSKKLLLIATFLGLIPIFTTFHYKTKAVSIIDNAIKEESNKHPSVFLGREILPMTPDEIEKLKQKGMAEVNYCTNLSLKLSCTPLSILLVTALIIWAKHRKNPALC